MHYWGQIPQNYHGFGFFDPPTKNEKTSEMYPRFQLSNEKWKPLKYVSSWWFQPIWKILYSQIGSFPQVGVKILKKWNHHLGLGPIPWSSTTINKKRCFLLDDDKPLLQKKWWNSETEPYKMVAKDFPRAFDDPCLPEKHPGQGRLASRQLVLGTPEGQSGRQGGYRGKNTKDARIPGDATWRCSLAFVSSLFSSLRISGDLKINISPEKERF